MKSLNDTKVEEILASFCVFLWPCDCDILSQLRTLSLGNTKHKSFYTLSYARFCGELYTPSLSGIYKEFEKRLNFQGKKCILMSYTHEIEHMVHVLMFECTFRIWSWREPVGTITLQCGQVNLSGNKCRSKWLLK